MPESLQLDKYVLDQPVSTRPLDRENILSHIATTAEDAGKAFVSSAVERPVNALVQIGNRTFGTEWLPELHIVGEPTHKGLATDLGTAAGTAVDYVLLSKAMGPAYDKLGIPKAGLIGAFTRAAATGALLEGVLTPSSSAGTYGDFMLDRFSNGVAGGAAFGSMSLIGAGLNKTGMFKPTLAGDIALGASTGFVGGATLAQIDSLVQTGRPAGVARTVSEGLSMAASGALLGGLGNGYKGLSTRLGRPSILTPELFPGR